LTSNHTLRDMGYDPYVMIYGKPNAPREIRPEAEIGEDISMIGKRGVNCPKADFKREESRQRR